MIVHAIPDGYIEEPIPEQRMNDAKLEVMGIFSSFHVAQLQLGLSQPHRLGQASHVKVNLGIPSTYEEFTYVFSLFLAIPFFLYCALDKIDFLITACSYR